MLKKPITYTDFNGETVTEEFYFNLTAAELARMELSASDNTTAGMQDYLNRVIKSGKGQDILDAFEKFITASYGQRSPDGRRFTKSPELLEDFKAIGAYDALFMQMVTDAEAGAKFVNGIMPADLAAKAQEIINQERAAGIKGESPQLAIVDELADSYAANDVALPKQDKPNPKKPRSREELLAAYREKNNRAINNKYVNMTEAEAMNLPEDEFALWVAAQPEAEQA